MAIRTNTLTITGAGTTPAIDIKDSNDIRIAWQVNVVGAVDFTIEHSLDGINFIANTDAVNQSSNIDGNYILPVRAVRLVNNNVGTCTLTVRQLIV